jgi:hypothetical protein
VVPLQALHAGPQCDAVSQALQAPASQRLPAAQLASETHWTHWPPSQILPATAQLAQLAPHFVAVSQLTHWPASHDLPAPQSTSAAHARQAPFAQPLGQVTGLSEYVQFPSIRVPLEPCVRGVFASVQSAAGRVLAAGPGALGRSARNAASRCRVQSRTRFLPTPVS